MRRRHALTIAAMAARVLLADMSHADNQVLFMDTGGHTATVHKVLFTPDGRYLLSVGDDKCVRVWKTATGEQWNIITGEMGEGYSDKLYAAALSPKGDVLAVAGTTHVGAVNTDFRNNHYVIRLLDIKSLDARPADVAASVLPAKDENGHVDAITALAFSPDGHTLASASQGVTPNNDSFNVIKLWNMNDRNAPPRDLILKSEVDSYISSVAFSPDGGRIAVSYLNGAIYVVQFDHADKPERLSESADEAGTDIAWSPDGSVIAASYAAHNLQSGKVLLWSGDKYQKMPDLRQTTQCYSSVSFTRDSRYLLTTAANHDATVWDWKSGEAHSNFTGHASPVTCGALDPADPNIVATAAMAPNEICLWDQSDGTARMKNRLVGVSGVTSAAAWSDDGKRLRWTMRSADGKEKTLVFDLDTASVAPAKSSDLGDRAWKAHDLKASGASIDTAHLTKDASQVTLDNGGSTRVLVNGSVSSNPTDTVTGPDSVSLTDNGKYAIVGSKYTLAVYTTASDGLGQVVPKYLLAGHLGSVTSVSVSPSPHSSEDHPQYIASTSTDGTVRIWSLTSGSSDKTTPMLGSNGQVVANITTLAPVVSIFAGSNDEWIAWCGNNNYYTSSPQAGKLVYLHYNHGEDKIGGDDRFQADLRQPVFFTEYLKSGDLDTAINKAIKQGLDKSAEEAKSEATKRLSEAPKAVWNTTPGDLTQSGSSASLKFTISTRIPCTVAYQVTVNNHDSASGHVVLTEDDHNKTEDCYTKLVALPAIRLRLGAQNKISVVPGTGAITGDAASVDVNCTKQKSDIPSNLWVLAIGVSRYRTFKDLNYPNVDAKSIVECLKKQEGHLYPHVYTPMAAPLTALTDEDATKANILQAIDKLSKAATENDTIMVFIAGHGGQDEQQNYYFLPYDTDTQSAQAVRETTIPWLEVQKLLKLPGRVFLFLDTCHAGGAVGTGHDAYEAVLAALSQANDKDQMPATIFASCNYGEISREAEKMLDNGIPKPIHHGVFTYALLQAFTPSADNPAANTKGYVTPDDLASYLHETVPHYSDIVAKQNQRQITDLEIDPTDPHRVRSATTGIGVDQIGWVLKIAGGNGFTAGDYLIREIGSKGSAVLNKPAGKTSSTGGSGILADETKQTPIRTGFVGDVTATSKMIVTTP